MKNIKQTAFIMVFLFQSIFGMSNAVAKNEKIDNRVKALEDYKSTKTYGGFLKLLQDKSDERLRKYFQQKFESYGISNNDLLPKCILLKNGMRCENITIEALKDNQFRFNKTKNFKFDKSVDLVTNLENLEKVLLDKKVFFIKEIIFSEAQAAIDWAIVGIIVAVTLIYSKAIDGLDFELNPFDLSCDGKNFQFCRYATDMVGAVFGARKTCLKFDSTYFKSSTHRTASELKALLQHYNLDSEIFNSDCVDSKLLTFNRAINEKGGKGKPYNTEMQEKWGRLHTIQTQEQEAIHAKDRLDKLAPVVPTGI